MGFGKKQGVAGKLEDEATVDSLKARIVQLEKELRSCKSASKGSSSSSSPKSVYYQKSIPLAPLIQGDGKEIPFVGETGIFPIGMWQGDWSMDLFSKNQQIQNVGGSAGYGMCKQVDIFFRQVKTERCLAVIDTKGAGWGEEGWTFSYDIDPTTKLVKPLSHRRIERNYQKGPGQHRSFIETRDKHLVPFIAGRQALINKVKKITSKYRSGSTVLTMCANEGHASLILNFVCNLRKDKIELPQHVFFVTTKELLKQFQSLGLNAFYDEVFDMFPKTHGVYGDHNFGIMVLLKQMSALLVLEAGFNVLFQVQTLFPIHTYMITNGQIF